MSAVLSPLRVGRITGSRVGAILGLSKWQTPDDVLRSMTREHFGDPAEFTGSDATDWGTEHEPDALLAYEQYAGVLAHSAQQLVIHPAHDWLAVTPDGLVGADGMVELKCPYRARYQSIREHPDYGAQVQLQLACTGRAWCDFVIWRVEGPLLVERVFADPEWLPSVLPALQAFHDRYEATVADEALAAPHRASIQRTDDAYGAAAARYLELADQRDHIDGLLAAARDELIGLAPDGAVGFGVQVVRAVRKGTVDYARLVRKHLPDVDVEEWRKPSQTVHSVRRIGDA